MAKRLGKFELPKRLVRVEETATPTFACFIAEPFEKGFGHTIGNALRRILLSAIEGGAIASVKIEGFSHEFQCCDGVLEDATEIVLNLKQVHLKMSSHEPVMLYIDVNKAGVVTAGDIKVPAGVEVVNPEQSICTLTKKHHFQAELKAMLGRGYRLAEENKESDQPLGVIAIDSLFSPVTRVGYRVEDARVGRMTDFDKLILEISTDGRVSPEEALKDAVAILRHHLDVFDCISSGTVEVDDEVSEVVFLRHSGFGMRDATNIVVSDFEYGRDDGVNIVAKHGRHCADILCQLVCNGLECHQHLLVSIIKSGILYISEVLCACI